MNITSFKSEDKAYISVECVAGYSFKLQSFRDKCAHIAALCVRQMMDSVRKTGIFALAVHYYIQFYRKAEPLALRNIS